MKYRVDYAQREYRSAWIEADSPEEAQTKWSAGDVESDDFDMADEPEFLGIGSTLP